MTKPSGAVIRAMIEAGMKPHDIKYPWRGLGREEALRAEKRRIAYLLRRGCVLANIVGNSRPASVIEVLKYLNVRQRRVSSKRPA